MLQNKNESLLEFWFVPLPQNPEDKRWTDLLQENASYLHQKENAILFTQVPENINPSEFRERGTGKDTAWRRANGVFLRSQLQELSKDSLILDGVRGMGIFFPFTLTFPISCWMSTLTGSGCVCDLIHSTFFSSVSMWFY
jgi:hypothetical protein